jgi:hypothetical protein
MRKIVLSVIAAMVAFSAPGTSLADGHKGKIQKYGEANVMGWLGSPEMIKAVQAQNAKHTSLSAADIDKLDKTWRAEKKAGGGALIESKMNNDFSTYLRGIKAKAGGVITEIFVMDNKGLNVGQTNGTGDYMQGDEAKWKKTFLVGPKAIFIDDVEKEDGINISQTSLTVVDSAGAPIGAVTIGFAVDKLK